LREKVSWPWMRLKSCAALAQTVNLRSAAQWATGAKAAEQSLRRSTFLSEDAKPSLECTPPEGVVVGLGPGAGAGIRSGAHANMVSRKKVLERPRLALECAKNLGRASIAAVNASYSQYRFDRKTAQPHVAKVPGFDRRSWRYGPAGRFLAPGIRQREETLLPRKREGERPWG